MDPVDCSHETVRAEFPRRPLRELTGDVGPPIGDGRDPEPHEQDHRRAGQEHPSHARELEPGPQTEQAQERPRLGPPQGGEHTEQKRPAVAADESHVDRGQREGDDHRVRLRAEDVVEVVFDSQHARPRHDGRHPWGVAAKWLRIEAQLAPADEPVGDPAGEHRSGQRHSRRGDHPQPQLVVPGHGVGHREQERHRLPGRSAAEVEGQVKRRVAPGHPAVRVVAGSSARPHGECRRHNQDHGRRREPRVLADVGAQRPGHGLARKRLVRRSRLRNGRCF